MWINLGRVSVLASLCMAASFGARAAGGHFDVDDATIVNPGRCQVEAWITRVPAEAATVFHVGPACRVGPVEIGLNFDHVRVTDEARNGFGPQGFFRRIPGG